MRPTASSKILLAAASPSRNPQRDLTDYVSNLLIYGSPGLNRTRRNSIQKVTVPTSRRDTVHLMLNTLKMSAHWLRNERVQISARLRQALAIAVAFTFAFSPAAQLFLPGSVAAKGMPAPSPSPNNSNGNCNLNSAHGEIQHVIYLQFDN